MEDMVEPSDEGGDAACWAHELDDDGRIPDAVVRPAREETEDDRGAGAADDD